jgi:hypothetical protein
MFFFPTLKMNALKRLVSMHVLESKKIKIFSFLDKLQGDGAYITKFNLSQPARMQHHVKITH